MYLRSFDELKSREKLLYLKAVSFIMSTWHKINFSDMPISLKGKGINTYSFNMLEYGMKRANKIKNIRFFYHTKYDPLYKTEIKTNKISVEINGVVINNLVEYEVFIIADFIHNELSKRILKDYTSKKYYHTNKNMAIK